MSKKEKALAIIPSDVLPAEHVFEMPPAIKNIVDGQLPETVEQACNVAAAISRHGRSHMLLWVWAVGRIVDDQQKKIGDETGKAKGHGSDVAGQVAKAIGTSAKFVRDAKRFYVDNPDANDVVKKGVDWSVAREILRLKDPEAKKEIETKAKEKKMTVRDVREEVDDVVAKEKKTEGCPEEHMPPQAPRPVSPLAYFRALLQELDSFQMALTEKTLVLADQLQLVSDDKRCPDEDYKLIAEGVDGGQSLCVAIARKSLSVSEHLQKYLEPLQRTFEEADAPATAKKK